MGWAERVGEKQASLPLSPSLSAANKSGGMGVETLGCWCLHQRKRQTTCPSVLVGESKRQRQMKSLTPTCNRDALACGGAADPFSCSASRLPHSLTPYTPRAPCAPRALSSGETAPPAAKPGNTCFCPRPPKPGNPSPSHPGPSDASWQVEDPSPCTLPCARQEVRVRLVAPTGAREEVGDSWQVGDWG